MASTAWKSIMPGMSDWTELARSDLLSRRDRAGAWSYGAGRSAAVEPTVLACLGLLQSRAKPGAETHQTIHQAARWLQILQQEDGSVGVSASLNQPGWPTPYAILLWKVLGLAQEQRQRSSTWLLAQKGVPVTDARSSGHATVGHDGTLVGWPWIAGTHSWVEPTALSIIALQAEGLGNDPRVAEGTKVIIDRALPRGGWNYGNTLVFGRQLRPQPGPTGLALLALASCAGKGRTRSVDPAIEYLRQTLPSVRAPISLGWGVLGLRAWNACPAAARSWLAESYTLYGARPDATAGLGLLLWASSEAAWPLSEHRL
jgi:hypothetical protein